MESADRIHLSYATIGYNSLEAIASLIAGLFAGSVALVGFGIDSLVEVSASGVAQWRLRADPAFETGRLSCGEARVPTVRSCVQIRGTAQSCSNLNDAKSDAVSCCAAFARARMTRRIDAPPLNALAIAYKSRGENLVPCPIA